MSEFASDIQSNVLWYALPAVLLPFASFLLSLLISDRYSWLISPAATALLLASVVLSLKTAIISWDVAPFGFSIPWFSLGGQSLTATIMFSRVSITLLNVVAIVSFLVHFFSAGYMAEDRSLQRYFAMLGFFTFSMQGIVLADNLLMVFFFWELVGFSSYLLIGHWTERPQAGKAATKAFLMNRVGDLGFIAGLMILWTQTSTLSISEVINHAPFEWQTFAALCIFLGVVGKSAQFPLLTWLPDAMEGPTPVSALIHAATMVAAGVYIVVRLFPLFTPDALYVVATVGLLTSLTGAVSALFQFDLKRILAWSTISQLGLMVTAIGAGACGAAFAHLVTHAFFKACLFLSAGSVIHSLHRAQQRSHVTFDEQDIRYMGGLRKKLPVTFITFSVGAASLAGLPAFSGFASKEAMLLTILANNTTFSWLLTAGLVIVSFLTAFYSTRMVWFVFFGTPRHDIAPFVERAPGVMRVSTILLALGSFWFAVSPNPFNPSGWLWTGPMSNWGVTFFSIVWGLGAVVLAFFVFRNRAPMGSVFFQQSLYLNNLYQRTFGALVTSGASAATYIDKKWIDGMIHAVAYTTATISHIVAWADRVIVDGLVNGVARIAAAVGAFVRSFQGGKIQHYISWAILAIIIFLISTLD